jgi:hypothetical protein
MLVLRGLRRHEAPTHACTVVLESTHEGRSLDFPTLEYIESTVISCGRLSLLPHFPDVIFDPIGPAKGLHQHLLLTEDSVVSQSLVARARGAGSI